MSVAEHWLHDVSEANWIVERLHPFAADVGSVIPEGFDAYARVFHPAWSEGGTTRRWADIAQENGRVVHAEMQLHMIERPVGTPLPPNKPQGQGYAERAVLVERLGKATATPETCWFGVWEGYGGLDDGGVSARIRVPQRAYLLTSGPIERALGSFIPVFDHSANLWWPDDRAWVVATEIDFAWTYVGGTRAVVEGLERDERIEALEAQITDHFTYDSDHVNARLDTRT
jgi:hypothetical protein